MYVAIQHFADISMQSLSSSRDFEEMSNGHTEPAAAFFNEIPNNH